MKEGQPQNYERKSTGNRKKLFIFALIVFIALQFFPQHVYAESAQQAEEITSRCRIDFGRYSDAGQYVLNKNVRSYATFHPGDTILVSWNDSEQPAKVCLQWAELPSAVSVLQYDADNVLIQEETLASNPESIIAVQAATRSVSISIKQKKEKLSQLHVYTEGILPEPFHEWKETPHNLDYLLIATHPDDDVLYLGSIVPLYGAERGYVGSIAYVTCQTRVRMTEAENGAWHMGLRYRPLFLGFPDVPREASKQKKATFVYEDVLRSIVRVYREYHPVVVFAQDKEGEYGHWQHKLTSRAATEAYKLAADASFDPESAETYGTWQVQKVFLHLYPINKLLIDANTPLEQFEGKDSFQVAKEAYKKHVTQQKTSFAVRRNNGTYAFNRFGMVEGTVPVGLDVFDHINEQLLSTYVSPTPTVTPEITPEPTEEPKETDVPSATPTISPPPTPFSVPTSSPAPETSNKTEGKVPLHVVIALGIVSIGLMASGLWMMRKSRKNMESSKSAEE